MDEILNLIESVSGEFPSYFCAYKFENEKGLSVYILYMHIAPFHSQPSNSEQLVADENTEIYILW